MGNVNARDPDFWNVVDSPPVNPGLKPGMENWMSGLHDNKSLAEVAIPGTHDTMARSSPLYKAGPAVWCQSLSLHDQLKLGIRFFDIRCRHFNDDLPIHHGNVYQNTNFTACVREMFGYLDQHDAEVIIMRVKEEHKAANNTKSFADAVDEVLSDFANRCWMKSEIPTISQVRGKVVILQDFKSIVPMGIRWCEKDSAGCRMIIADEYNHNLHDKYEEIMINLAIVTDKIKLTFSSSAASVNLRCCPKCCGKEIPEPGQFARKMNPRLQSYVRIHQSIKAHPCFGIIAMDYPGPQLVADIVKQNDLSKK